MPTPNLKPESIHNVSQALVSRSFEYLQVHPNWFVYRLSYSLTLDGPANIGGFARQYPDSVQEGFSPMSTLEAMKAGAAPGKEHVQTGEPLVVPANLRDQIATRPTHEVIQELQSAAAYKAPFTALTENPALIQDLLLWSGYSSTFMDLAGTPMPQPLMYSYMDGMMCDGAYDLEKALAVLKADPRVKATDEATPFYPERGTLRLTKVPSYNSRPGHRWSLDFWFTPTSEDMAKMLAHDPEARTFDDARRKAVFDLDLLGLRAAGAARHAAYGEYSASPGDSDD